MISESVKMVYEMMSKMLQLPPIPPSILGLSNIEIKNASLNSVGDFIIKVRSAKKEKKFKILQISCKNMINLVAAGLIL